MRSINSGIRTRYRGRHVLRCFVRKSRISSVPLSVLSLCQSRSSISRYWTDGDPSSVDGTK